MAASNGDVPHEGIRNEFSINPSFYLGTLRVVVQLTPEIENPDREDKIRAITYPRTSRRYERKQIERKMPRQRTNQQQRQYYGRDGKYKYTKA